MSKHLYRLAPANYDDYRDFLKARFEEIRDRQSIYSLQYLAQKTKLSKALFSMLFKKERHIQLDRLPAIAKVLKMSEDEEAYIYLSICKSASKNRQVQEHFDAILSRIRGLNIMTESPLHQKASEGHRSDPIDPVKLALKTLALVDGFKASASWIIENIAIPDLTKEEADQALSSLLKAGEIQQNADGRFVEAIPSYYHPEPYDPNSFQIHIEDVDFLRRLMKNCRNSRPSFYGTLHLLFDEENLKKVEVLMRETYEALGRYSRASTKPTATIFVAQHFLTLYRNRR